MPQLVGHRRRQTAACTSFQRPAVSRIHMRRGCRAIRSASALCGKPRRGRTAAPPSVEFPEGPELPRPARMETRSSRSFHLPEYIALPIPHPPACAISPGSGVVGRPAMRPQLIPADGTQDLRGTSHAAAAQPCSLRRVTRLSRHFAKWTYWLFNDPPAPISTPKTPYNHRPPSTMLGRAQQALAEGCARLSNAVPGRPSPCPPPGFGRPTEILAVDSGPPQAAAHQQPVSMDPSVPCALFIFAEPIPTPRRSRTCNPPPCSAPPRFSASRLRLNTDAPNRLSRPQASCNAATRPLNSPAQQTPSPRPRLGAAPLSLSDGGGGALLVPSTAANFFCVCMCVADPRPPRSRSTRTSTGPTRLARPSHRFFSVPYSRSNPICGRLMSRRTQARLDHTVAW